MHIFSGVLSTQNVNVARFARNNDETLSVNFKHLAIVRRENNCNLLASSVFFSQMIQQLINIHDYIHVRTQNTVVLFMSFFLCSTNHHKTNETET